MADTFASLLGRLAQNQIKFIIIGGVAVCLNGFVRTTEDLDILVETSSENLDRLLETLSKFGEGHSREFKKEDFSLEPGAVRLYEDFYLDIFTLLEGKDFAYYEKDSLSYFYRGVAIRYLSPFSLLNLKRNSQREKDRVDAEILHRIMRGETASEKVDLSKIRSEPETE